MPLISSPVAYPPSSSPPNVSSESRKRTNPGEPHVPTKRRLLGDGLFANKGRKSGEDGLSILGHDRALSEIENPPCDSLFTEVDPFMDDVDSDQDDDARPKPANRSQPVMIAAPRAPEDSGSASGQVTVAASIKTSLTSDGKRYLLRQRNNGHTLSYERLIAQRSTTAPGRAMTSYYGIDIHKIIDEANKLAAAPRPKTPPETAASVLPSIEGQTSRKANRTLMWTEKYRARKFTDLVGDERTHRSVLRWLKSWDQIVFPGTSKQKARTKGSDEQSENIHRKILLITGPPGLGKTTLAHVCAKQAGYEVVEINASDERSRDVVKGRIKDCLGTENVKGVNTKVGESTVRKAGRPVCVVVDEVDGVVGGSSGSGGEGGIMKALIDLIMLDQKNSTSHTSSANSKKRKGDQFRILRPMILVCNDVYHPSLRPLRSSNLAEIIHIRKPPLDKVIARLASVFTKEGVMADTDGVRRLCEATWGISSRKEGRSATGGTNEGDMRGVLVVGEWAAGKLRATAPKLGATLRLTKPWVETHMIADLASGGSGARGIGRGGTKEAASRVFMENAGFPKSTAKLKDQTLSVEPNKTSSVSDLAKGRALAQLREVVDSCGEHDRLVTDIFTEYPSRPFQDDTFLSKPNEAYEWLHFHDTLSSKVFSNQEFELSPYLSQSILGFHYLFASPAKQSWIGDAQNGKTFGEEENKEPLPFTGPRADFDAYEAQKQNLATLQSLQSSLSIPLFQSFRSPDSVATDLLPHLSRMLNPDVKPVLIAGVGDQRSSASVRRESEKEMVRRGAEAMGACGVSFERVKVEDERGSYGGFVYRMEP